VNDTFWRGKRVFVTGHTGFKGGWLSMWLMSLGAEVRGYALAPDTEPSLFELAGIGDIVDSRFADVRDGATLAASMVEFSPDIVFHLAAQPLVRLSYKEPASTFETNVMGTINLLEAVRGCSSVSAVVCVTSDKCYLNREWHWGYREHEALGGHDPYSASKACAELAVQAWRLSFLGEGGQDSRNCPVGTGRAGNVIGGGDWSADRLVPDILAHLADERPVTVRNPVAIRPWQHVLEPLSGYLMLAERLADSDGQGWADSWNFGPPDADARTVEGIVATLIDLWPDGGSWNHDGSVHPHEARYLKLDCSKSRDRLGWRPIWSLDQTLADIVEWHRAYLDGQSVRDTSLATINRYLADARRSHENLPPTDHGRSGPIFAAGGAAASLPGDR